MGSDRMSFRDLTESIYKNMGHTVSQDELDKANELIFEKSL
jgi:hypothetical protein